MEINFKPSKHVGFAHQIPHVTPDGAEVIHKMLLYDKDERWTASQVLKHPYFKELRDADNQRIS